MVDQDNSSAFRVGDWFVEPSQLTIWRDGNSVVLEPRLMDLLVFLAERAGETVSIDELADSVWAGRAMSDQPVYQSVAQLRKVLKDDAHHPKYIVTITKKGYRLIAPVVASGEPLPAAGKTIEPGVRQRVMSPLLAIVLAGSYLFLSTSDVSVSRESFVTEALEYGSIAVLPFTDLSDDQSSQFFGDGIADELIHRIGAIPDMRVVARASSFTYRDESSTIQEIGEQLGADLIIEGTVKRSGDSVRIAARMIDAETGYRVWSHTYETNTEQAFSVQYRIAAGVARSLRSGGDADFADNRSWTSDADAAEAYYLGQFHMHKRRAGPLARSIAYFEEAIRIDPEFAQAYALLAFALFLASDDRFGTIPSDEAARRSKTALRKAQILDDQLPQVIVLLAEEAWGSNKFDKAESLLLRAIEIDPNFAHAYQTYAFLLGDTGRHREALDVLQTASRIDPLNPVRRVNLAGSYHRFAMPAEAEAEYLTAIELDPNWHLPYVFLADLYAESNRLARAITLGQEAFRIEGPGARFIGHAAMDVGYSFLTLGNYDQAEHWFERGADAGVDGWFFANYHMHLLLAQGKFDEADALLKSWEAREPEHENIFILGGLYRAMMNQNDAAIAMLEHALSLQTRPDDDFLYMESFVRWGYLPALHLSRLYALSGQPEKSKSLLRACDQYFKRLSDDGRENPGIVYARASFEALRGDRRAAMSTLQTAVDEGWSKLWFLEQDPLFSDLRTDVGFESIVFGLRERLAAELTRVPE